jgi:hypothetical protein
VRHGDLDETTWRAHELPTQFVCTTGACAREINAFARARRVHGAAAEESMKKLIVTLLFVVACAVQSEPTPEPRAAPGSEVTEALPQLEPEALWKCGGQVAFFEWKCNTFNGEWEKVYVGLEERNCGYPQVYELEGRTTLCRESAQYACGGGDDDGCNLDTCEFPPPTACNRVPVDPPPCCLK